MILNDKFCFVHIPKNAGSSCYTALGNKSVDIPTHAMLSSVETAGVFSFGFVRNPWDRMVSLYQFICQKTVNTEMQFAKQQYYKSMGFKAWLIDEDFKVQAGDKWGGIQTPLRLQEMDQFDWLEGAHYVGQFEQLDQDLCEAARLGKFDLHLLPHINRSKHTHYSRYYDDETLEFVRYHHMRTINAFAYQFQNA